jgi:hypothetical protein
LPQSVQPWCMEHRPPDERSVKSVKSQFTLSGLTFADSFSGALGSRIQNYLGRRTTTLPVTEAVSPFQDFAVTVTRYVPGLAG